MMVLLPFETNRIKNLRQRGVQEDDTMAQLSRLSNAGHVNELLEPIRLRIRSNHKQLTPVAQTAYRAFLAYYIANATNLKPAEVVEYASSFAVDSGLASLPPLEAKFVSKLKLDGLVEKKTD